MNWLESHVYIAAWTSPTVALIGLLIRNTLRPADKVNWSMIMVYVAFLTCLAATLTPGIESQIRYISYFVGTLTLGYIMVDANRRR
jgi:hypothetical protein